MSDLMEWIEPCLRPFAETPCGEDPRYLEAFEDTKVEIEKLGNSDYALILKNGYTLLSENSKDLRVAGFMWLALIHQHQIPGLVTGLYLYKELVRRFPNDIHPRNERGRLSAIKWLNAPKIAAAASNYTLQNEAEKKHLIELVKELNSTIRLHWGNESLLFNGLDNWLSQPLPKHKAPSCETKEESMTSSKPNDEIQINELSDEKQAAGMHHQLLNYALREKNWLQAVQLARAWRWSKLSIPVAKKNKTTLLPPRKEAFIQLEKMSIEDNVEARLAFCEALFMEPSGLFFLDVQWHSYQAAHQLGETALCEYLLDINRWLIRQHPELLKLCFSNGQPFCDDTTKHWLKEPEVIQDKTVQEQIPRLSLENLVQSLKNPTLESILQALEAGHVVNPEDHLHLLQTKAQACVMYKKHELAWFFYKALLDKMDESLLATWLPKRALRLWHEVLQFIEGAGGRHLPLQKAETIAENLRQKMYLTNSHQAYVYLNKG